jgi:transposase-like protein
MEREVSIPRSADGAGSGRRRARAPRCDALHPQTTLRCWRRLAHEGQHRASAQRGTVLEWWGGLPEDESEVIERSLELRAEHLYAGKGLSINRVAQRLGRSAHDVEIWLHRRGVPIRSNTRRFDPQWYLGRHSVQEAISLASEGVGVPEIARRLGVTGETVRRWFRLVEPLGVRVEAHGRRATSPR